MRDPFAKARGLSVFVIVMKGMIVARKPGEEEEMGVGERLGWNIKLLTKLEIFKVFGCFHQYYFQEGG